MTRHRALLILILLLSGPAYASTEGESPTDAFHRTEWQRRVGAFLLKGKQAEKIPSHAPVYDVDHYKIDITLDPEDSTLAGTVWIYARSLVETLSSIDLDLIDTVRVDTLAVDSAATDSTSPAVRVLTMEVDSVSSNGVAFSHENDLLEVTLDGPYDSSEALSVRVDYHGSPRPFHRNGLTWGHHGSTPVVYTMVEPFFSHHWWPCKDVPWDKADSVEVVLTVPEGLVGVSNGLRVRVDSSGAPGWKSYVWKHKHPIPPYLVMLAVSNYDLIQGTYDGGAGGAVPLSHYVYPEDLVPAESTFSLVPAMLERLETVYGDYPFSDERYGHVAVRGAGAMEHNTCTSFGDMLIVGNRGSDGVVVHELGHQWWGDLVTCEDWNDIWLNEGFATYTEALWYEGRGGQASLTSEMSRIEYHGSQSVYVDPVPDNDSLFTSRYVGAIYSKGAWVLHMLRHAVGDSTFFRILERHRNDSLDRGGLANTAQFQTTCEEVSGRDFDRFFRQWVYLTGSPTFAVDPYVSASGETLWVRFAQDAAQDTCFASDLELTIDYEDGADSLFLLPLASWTDTFAIAAGGRIAGVRFDVENWLLDEGFDGPVDEALAIADEGGHVLLSWETNDSLVSGIQLYRGPSGEGPWQAVNDPDLPLPASGSYDDGAPQGVAYYQIRAVSESLPGYESTPSNIVQTGSPSETALVFGSEDDPASSNPYILGGEAYRLRFHLAETGDVLVQVYDITGRLVRTLHDGAMEAGYGREIAWNGDNSDGRLVAPGIYLIRFETGGRTQTRKVVVLK